MILTSERAQVSRVPVLSPALATHVVDGGQAVGVVDGPGDVDVAGHAGPECALSLAGTASMQQAEAVWRGAGGGIPLYAAISSLLTDTGLVILRGQELTRAESVTRHHALDTGEPLDTVMRGAAGGNL